MTDICFKLNNVNCVFLCVSKSIRVRAQVYIRKPDNSIVCVYFYMYACKTCAIYVYYASKSVCILSTSCTTAKNIIEAVRIPNNLHVNTFPIDWISMHTYMILRRFNKMRFKRLFMWPHRHIIVSDFTCVGYCVIQWLIYQRDCIILKPSTHILTLWYIYLALAYWTLRSSTITSWATSPKQWLNFWTVF